MMLESGWWRYLLLLGLPQCHGSWLGGNTSASFAMFKSFMPWKLTWNLQTYAFGTTVSSFLPWKCGFDSFSGALFFQVGHQLRPENRTTLPGWNFHSNSCRSTSFSSFSQWFLFVLGLRSDLPGSLRSQWCTSHFVMAAPTSTPILLLQSTTFWCRLNALIFGWFQSHH